MIEIGHVEAFLAVADELHFAKAAQRLLISPSRVSQLVRQVENQVGAPLFERTTRRVTLTAIGEQLAADLRKIYADLADALATARAAAQGLDGTITVGYLTHCDDDAFTALVSCFRSAQPCCEVTTIDITGTDYFGALRSGDIDVALGRFHQDPPADLVQGPVLSREDWLLGVAAGHPLAALAVVPVEELASYPIFGVPDALTGKLHNPLYPVLTPSGRPIERRGIARTFAEVLALVASKEIVFPVTESFPRHYGHPAVVFRPLRGWPPGTRTLIWRAHGNAPPVIAFTRLASQQPPRPEPGYRTWTGPRISGSACSPSGRTS